MFVVLENGKILRIIPQKKKTCEATRFLKLFLKAVVLVFQLKTFLKK